MILLRHGQSEFNLHYSRTRLDPGLLDPGLTDEGRAQALDAAATLRDYGAKALLVSPYRRTLETAAVVAEALSLPIFIEPLVRERAAFSCDVGTAASRLAILWPTLDFSAIEERWWHEGEEPETSLLARSWRFRSGVAQRPDWRELAVVSHWGFIRALTGHALPNCASVIFDPTAP